jgi:hypothetical protein
MKATYIDIDGSRGAEFNREKLDCTVHAIAIAAQMPYSAAHRELELAGRKPRKGFSTAKFIEFKQNRIANYAVLNVPLFAIRPTWDNVKHLTREGRYLVRVTGHVFAVIDGVIHDGVPSGGRCRVKGIFKLEAL